MKAVEILQSVQVGTFFAKMEDGTYRWTNLCCDRLLGGGPRPEWVQRGLTAHSVAWGGPSIQRPLCHDILLAMLNRGLDASPAIA